MTAIFLLSLQFLIYLTVLLPIFFDGIKRLLFSSTFISHILASEGFLYKLPFSCCLLWNINLDLFIFLSPTMLSNAMLRQKLKV